MSLVLDASLIAAWVLPDEHVPAADRIVAGSQPPMVVPSIFPFEIANILLVAMRRGRLSMDHARRALSDIWALPIDVESVPLPALCHRLLPLADAHGLSIYDAAYLELAMRRRLMWATLDEPLARSARACSVALA